MHIVDNLFQNYYTTNKISLILQFSARHSTINPWHCIKQNSVMQLWLIVKIMVEFL